MGGSAVVAGVDDPGAADIVHGYKAMSFRAESRNLLLGHLKVRDVSSSVDMTIVAGVDDPGAADIVRATTR
jgi:hypothetical protein